MKAAEAIQTDTPDMSMADMRANAQRAAKLLKSMSNPVRLMVLCKLAEGEKSVGELELNMPLSQSALSQHLALLRTHKLVKTRRSGQSIYYSLAGVEASAILATLYELFCADAAKSAVSAKQERKPVPRLSAVSGKRRAGV